MKIVRLLAAIVFLGLSTNAISKTWAEQSTFGIGIKSCAEWIADRASHNPEAMNLDVEWMFGFITALGRLHGPNGVGGMAPEDFPGEIDSLCKRRPNITLPEAAEMIGVKHGLIAPPPD